MSEAFLKVVNMSISAGWLVLAVLALRLILKKAPKWVNVLLWGIVAVRLICPFSIESALSLIPSTETISPEIMMDWTPEISTGIEPLDQAVNPVISTSFAPQGMASANPLQILIPVAANLWLLGVLILLAYTAISYLTLRYKLRTAVILRDNIFRCETVSSPFVLGILKPRIFLPYAMDGKNLSHVVAHEKAHIRRKDHWWKPLGFLLLTVYWFNPLMWVAYILQCRDIELACDEKVIAELGNEQRADYTHALVACAVNRRMITACPLAFGEVGVKDRVKSIMNYRKPTFWIVVTALVVCVAVAVCFLTDPAGTSLTKWTIDEVDMSDTLGDIDTMSVQYYGDSITCNYNDINRFVATMSKIKVGRNSLSQSRDENRDYAFTITINDGLHLHFTIDFSEIWVDNGVKPSFSYPITNPETAGELMLDFSFAHKGTVEQWFDYSDNHSEMQWDGIMEANIPEFPDITFRWYPEKMDAVTDQGITTLYMGMPIWSAYFCDLTGDGLPEICSQVSYGSGIIDSRVIIFDYAKGVSYSLIDRGYHDYYLRMNEADGYLYVDKHIYNTDEVVSSGRLVFKNDTLQLEEVSSNSQVYPDFSGKLNLGLNAEIIDIDYNQKILYVKDIDDSDAVFGDRSAINCSYAISRKNLCYVNYEDPNDVRTIDFSAFVIGDDIIIGMYESEKQNAFNGTAFADQVQLGTQRLPSKAEETAQAFDDEALIRKISKKLDIPADSTIAFAGEYESEKEFLLWFIIDGSYSERYVAVRCEKTNSGKYQFEEILSTMTYAEGIVHALMDGEDIFLINNANVRAIVYQDESGNVVKQIEIKENDCPYVFLLSQPVSPCICSFVDSNGEEIR
jgi:beta-lactamase regulating signal transducer with metallopeptidase domain